MEKDDPKVLKQFWNKEIFKAYSHVLLFPDV